MPEHDHAENIAALAASKELMERFNGPREGNQPFAGSQRSTKAILAQLREQDVTVEGWVDTWLKDHSGDLSEWAKGYIAAKLEEIYNSLSSNSSDFLWEFTGAVETALSHKP